MSQINVLGKWEATRESRLWVKIQMIKPANDKNCLFYFYWVKCQETATGKRKLETAFLSGSHNLSFD